MSTATKSQTLTEAQKSVLLLLLRSNTLSLTKTGIAQWAHPGPRDPERITWSPLIDMGLLVENRVLMTLELTRAGCVKAAELEDA